MEPAAQLHYTYCKFLFLNIKTLGLCSSVDAGIQWRSQEFSREGGLVGVWGLQRWASFAIFH